LESECLRRDAMFTPRTPRPSRSTLQRVLNEKVADATVMAIKQGGWSQVDPLISRILELLAAVSDLGGEVLRVPLRLVRSSGRLALRLPTLLLCRRSQAHEHHAT